MLTGMLALEQFVNGEPPAVRQEKLGEAHAM